MGRKARPINLRAKMRLRFLTLPIFGFAAACTIQSEYPDYVYPERSEAKSVKTTLAPMRAFQTFPIGELGPNSGKPVIAEGEALDKDIKHIPKSNIDGTLAQELSKFDKKVEAIQACGAAAVVFDANLNAYICVEEDFANELAAFDAEVEAINNR